MTSTRSTRRINAPRAAIYRALLDARTIEMWRAPVGMTCQVHELSAREGGSFRVSLTYDSEVGTGKSTNNIDTYRGHFKKLVPNELVVEVIEFETGDSAMRGEMTITTALTDVVGGTEIVVNHEGMPRGVSASDNVVGTEMSLEKLAVLVEATPTNDLPDSRR